MTVKEGVHLKPDGHIVLITMGPYSYWRVETGYTYRFLRDDEAYKLYGDCDFLGVL